MKKLVFALLLFSALAFAQVESVQASVTVLDAKTTLSQSSSPSSLPSPGTAVFACNYMYGRDLVFNGECTIFFDGQRFDAQKPYFDRAIQVSAGTHSWYCSCKGTGFAPQAGQPQEFVASNAVPSAGGDLQISLRVIDDANKSIAQAQGQGLDTSDAESYLHLASLALAQNDTARANSFAASARVSAENAPPKSVLFFLNSLNWLSPLTVAAALVVVAAGVLFFRSYRRRE